MWWHKRMVRLRADRSAADWQVYYNAGCFYALLGELEKAYRFVDLALDSGGYAGLKRWCKDDPDLAELRKNRHELRSIFVVPAGAALVVASLVLLIAFPWLAAAALVLYAAYVLVAIAAYKWRDKELAKLVGTTTAGPG
jgi:UDP-N-acetylmuramyl pentapeptide synthase